MLEQRNIIKMELTGNGVVSLEICIGKFPEIYSNLSGNLRKFVKYLFSLIRFNYNHVSNSSIAK